MAHVYAYIGSVGGVISSSGLFTPGATNSGKNRFIDPKIVLHTYLQEKVCQLLLLNSEVIGFFKHFNDSVLKTYILLIMLDDNGK